MKTLFIRSISALFVFALSFSYVHAQKLRIGVAGGVGYTKLDFETFSSPSGSLTTHRDGGGLRIAVPVELGFNKYFALQPELLYSEQAIIYDEDYVEYASPWTFRHEYSGTFQYQTLEIPILAKLKLGSGWFKAYLGAGPAVALPLKGEWVYSEYFSQYSVNEGYDFDFYKGAYAFKFTSDGYDPYTLGNDELAFSKILYNVHLNAGLEFSFNRFGFFIDGRYVQGLNDLFPDERDAELGWSAKQNTLGITLGAFVALGSQ